MAPSLHKTQLMKVCLVSPLLHPHPSSCITHPVPFHTHSHLLMLLFSISDLTFPHGPPATNFASFLDSSFPPMSLPPGVNSHPGQPNPRNCPLAQLPWSLCPGNPLEPSEWNPASTLLLRNLSSSHISRGGARDSSEGSAMAFTTLMAAACLQRGDKHSTPFAGH